MRRMIELFPMIETERKPPPSPLNDQSGDAHSLSDYAGRPVVLLLPERRHTRLHGRVVRLPDNLPKFKPR